LVSLRSLTISDRRGHDINGEFLGKSLRVIQPVAQPVQSPRGRYVGQELLHLHDIKRDILSTAHQRDRTHRHSFGGVRHLIHGGALLQFGHHCDRGGGKDDSQEDCNAAGDLRPDVHGRAISCREWVDERGTLAADDEQPVKAGPSDAPTGSIASATALVTLSTAVGV
jgi:hypothetical protein